MRTRRAFIKQVIAGSSVLAASAYVACRPQNPLAHIKGSIAGANSATGHLLRNIASLPEPSRHVAVDTLIVGGGISGLSAKRWLQREGHKDVMLLEMDNHFGGNSHHGKNSTSAYPWGAHYIPVPDIRNTELLDFLHEINVIRGFENQLPVYNPYYLCHDPEERLYINGIWQDGIVPEAGVPAAEKDQIRRFFKTVSDYKVSKGSDGKDAFSIPVDNSSADELFRKLDQISFRQYLQQQGYTSRYLLWYLEYGCKDDYACNLDTTSAWAGIHYFASRKGSGVGVNSASVLTWPQGNGFLMDHLREQLPGDELFSAQLVYDIQEVTDGIRVKVYDVDKKESYFVDAKKAIMAAPQFVNKRLLRGVASAERVKAFADFHYAPWVIANITVSNFPRQRGMPVCWDNVIYGKPSVGYVDANHQDLGRGNRKVVTFYLPFADGEPDTIRQKIQPLSYEHWLSVITDEMEYAHPGITQYIESADVWLWGHGMISPRPGFIWGDSRKTARENINNKIFFAHSDLSGISIFEEAFYQGIKAANELMKMA